MEINNEEEHVEHISNPDEKSGLLVEGKIKIFDPESKEVYLEGRA